MRKTTLTKQPYSGAADDCGYSHDLPRPNRSPESPYAQAVLGVSKTDPFDTLPLSLSYENEQLVDIWMHRITFWSGRSHHIKMTLFNEALLHNLTFQVVVLAYCARYRAYVSEMTHTPQSIAYVSESKRYLNSYASDPKDNIATMALVSLALQEERY